MIINCGFSRKRRDGKGFEFKSVKGIRVEGLDFKTDSAAIRTELRKHAPAGDGWLITGYCLWEK